MLLLLATQTVLWGASAQHIDTTGCYQMALDPIAACRLESVSVDTASECVRITWYVNDGEGVAGYCICSGSPCLPLDTLWGASDTTYLCSSHRADELHSYRIFAIDSCLHGGELTDAVSNMVLHLSADSCSRVINCSWTAASMETAAPQYALWLQTDEGLLIDTVGDVLSYQAELPLSTMRLRVRVAALDDGVTVWSNVVETSFLPTDACASSDTSQHPETKKPANPYLPNCFTPTLSTNNCFAPRFPAASIPDEYHLSIYNRVGALVYQTRDLSACWNGTLDGNVLPMGAYVYYITYRYADDWYRLTGTFLLMR